MSKGVADSENRYLFESMASPERSIDRFFVLSTLYGLNASDPNSSRVLEIGCGGGINIIAQAWRFPGSHFVGIDSDVKQIEKARQTASELALTNCEFIEAEVEDATFDKSFDYIICHGLFSWASKKTQAAILKLCHEYASENAAIYLSYNALPGWFLRGVISDHLRRADKKRAPLDARIQMARKLIEEMKAELGENVGTEDQERVKRELENCFAHSDAFIMHELLNPDARGFHFRQFLSIVEESGFKYLADALPTRMREWRYNEMAEEFDLPEVQNKDAPLIEKEQQMDHLFPISFRATLLMRNVNTRRDKPDTSKIREWYISSPLVPLSEKPDLLSTREEIFCASSDVSTEVTAPILKSAFIRLREAWPSAVQGDELYTHALHLSDLEDQATLRAFLEMELVRYYLAGMVEFHSVKPACLNKVPEHPLINPCARIQAKQGDWVVTERHEYYILNPFEKLLVPLCDGGNGIESIVETMKTSVAEAELTPHVEGEAMDNDLAVRELVADHVLSTLEIFKERGLLSEAR